MVQITFKSPGLPSPEKNASPPTYRRSQQAGPPNGHISKNCAADWNRLFTGGMIPNKFSSTLMLLFG